MPHGAVEVIVLSFPVEGPVEDPAEGFLQDILRSAPPEPVPGRGFADVVEEFRELVEAGTVELLDLLLVVHETDGTRRVLEGEDDAGPLASGRSALDRVALLRLLALAGAGRSPLLSRADGELVADSLAPGSAAVVVAYEHTWAGPLGDAVRAAGGQVALQVRIPPKTVATAELAGVNA